MPKEVDHQARRRELADAACRVIGRHGLAAAADDAAQRLQEPLTTRIAHAIQTGELPTHLDPGHEATRLQLLIYGLMVELATTTTPRRHLAKWAQAILDEHIAALAAAPAPPPERNPPARRR